MEISNDFLTCSILLAFALINPFGGVQGSIGVNYGTLANNLPQAEVVAHFLLHNTIINRVRLFDVNPDTLRAFAHTGIEISINVPNDQIPDLTKLSFAQQWINSHVVPYIPATNIVRILVGNEVLSTANRLLIGSLVPAMQNLHTALVGMSLERRIKVSTPHSLGLLSSSSPPSTGKFRKGYDTVILKPLLSFLRATNSPFMINPYPFFGCSADTLDYALFRSNSGVLDENTQLRYTNMLDGQLDAIFSAMKLLGFADVDIVIAETGWPSKGDEGQTGVDVESAAQYNANLIKHVTSGLGTPLMPNRTFETYIFALFNENLKPGPIGERNFGLFEHDMTPVYDVGILRSKSKTSLPTNPSPRPDIISVSPSPSPSSAKATKQWCIPKSGVDPEALQQNIDYVCGLGMDCGAIQAGGSCFLPNTLEAHAAYAMNTYYQAMGSYPYDCDFKQTATVTSIDPSKVFQLLILARK
ncbi:glucan endo-1,3-beta-glucosidase [Thalictrum thalictroides]|uniref:glucan endo-1,3-beta-D-glucosidase n=1 Tax=Thalictrum thalictroides TaxID=46969 RepID=A0A7J6V1F5_THATH|nr:glucan endo-1,3-beta-glucosidase [Thalictrum thalictroides]